MASGRGLAALLAHREGYRTFAKLCLNASELGIRYLTVTLLGRDCAWAGQR